MLHSSGKQTENIRRVVPLRKDGGNHGGVHMYADGENIKLHPSAVGSELELFALTICGYCVYNGDQW